MNLQVYVQKIRENATVPQYMSEGAAGMDLAAALYEPVMLKSGERATIPTGIALAIPAGYEGQVRPRSGWAAAFGVTCLNAPGTIDSDYRGEIKVVLVNFGDQSVRIAPGDRIAQLVFAPIVRVSLRVVDALEHTPRGQQGFGSTGK